MTPIAVLQLGGALPVFGVLFALLTLAIAALKRRSTASLVAGGSACPSCEHAVEAADEDCPACGRSFDSR